jgi:predicted XRE-type DNA-binding protein
MRVRRAFQKALAEEARASGLTQSEIARRLGVHRSVINRELRGTKDITLGRVGELAWAMGREISFELPKIHHTTDSNSLRQQFVQHNPAPVGMIPVSPGATVAVDYKPTTILSAHAL